MTERTPQERANARRYSLHMAGASVLYLALTLVPPFFVERGTTFAVVLMFVPLVAVAWMLFAIVQFVRNLDEYVRPLAMTASAIAFAVSMLGALSLGILEIGLGSLPWGIWGVFVLGMSAWGIAMVVLTRGGGK